MFRLVLVACVLQAFTTAALAQTEKLPPDLAGLSDEIKTLKWQTIDTKTVASLEHCRALLLMNHTLDELCNNVTAEADLMSSYIEKNSLGTQFASTPPPPSPAGLSYADAEKVAIALLRGPMSASYYATELGDLSPSTLLSYQQMYARTCQRRWSEFDESRHLVRCMSSFLGNADKLQDYDAWATAESARRELEHQQHLAAAPAAAKDAAAQQKMQAQIQQQQKELQQMQAALAAAHAQQAQQPQGAAQGQPQQAAQVQQTYPPGYAAPAGAYGYGGYGGYGYGATPAGAAAAGAYAGANAANNANKNEAAAAGAAGAAAANNADKNQAAKAAAAGQYHGANSSWNKSSSYHGQAQAQTQQRMSSFHGASGAGATHGTSGHR